jgi:hypothetical protein
MKSANLQPNQAIRLILAATAISPFLFAAACDLRKPDTSDAGAAAVTVTAPAATDTTAATADTTAATAATPIATVAPPGAKHTGKIVNLPNGQKGAVVSLADGGTAIVPTSADGGIPGLSGFTIPTALPAGVPSTIPTTLPSGFPTTLPSGFHLPTFPPPAASH